MIDMIEPAHKYYVIYKNQKCEVISAGGKMWTIKYNGEFVEIPEPASEEVHPTGKNVERDR